MQQFLKEENRVYGSEQESAEVKGFVSHKIFKTLLLIGISCSATGFFVDMFIQSVPRIVTIMTASLCVYLLFLLSFIQRIDLHNNMRLAFLGVMIGGV